MYQVLKILTQTIISKYTHWQCYHGEQFVYQYLNVCSHNMFGDAITVINTSFQTKTTNKTKRIKKQ